MALLIHAFLRSGVDTEDLAGLLAKQPMGRDYAMSRRLRSGSRSARKGARDRNGSTAWRRAALASLVFRSAPCSSQGQALTPEHAARGSTARRAFLSLMPLISLIPGE